MERHPFGGTQECAHCGFECAVRDRLPSNFGARYAYYFGPAKNIAGILNKEKNVLGMMPHPERMIDSCLSGEDGSLFFKNLLNNIR